MTGRWTRLRRRIGTEESWKNLLAGQSGITTITSFDAAGFDCIAGEVKNFDPFNGLKKELKKMGPVYQLARPARILR